MWCQAMTWFLKLRVWSSFDGLLNLRTFLWIILRRLSSHFFYRLLVGSLRILIKEVNWDKRSFLSDHFLFECSQNGNDIFWFDASIAFWVQRTMNAFTDVSSSAIILQSWAVLFQISENEFKSWNKKILTF